MGVSERFGGMKSQFMQFLLPRPVGKGVDLVGYNWKSGKTSAGKYISESPAVLLTHFLKGLWSPGCKTQERSGIYELTGGLFVLA